MSAQPHPCPHPFAEQGASARVRRGVSLAAAAITTAALALAIAGCATASFDGTTYRTKQTTLKIGPRPASWQRIETSHGLLAYRDEAYGATIVLNGRCDEPSDDAPLASLTQHLFLLFTERQIDAEETIPFDGREARRTTLTAKLDGVPKRFVALVTKKDNCVYDFVLIGDGEAARYAAARRDFDAFVGGFHAEPR